MNFFANIDYHRFRALLLKELRQLWRNKLLLYLLLVPPILQLLILSASLDPELHHLKIAVFDQSNSLLSRQLLESIASSNFFDLSETSGDIARLEGLLESQQIAVIVVIPQHLVFDLASQKKIELQLIIDGSDAYKAKQAEAYLHATLLDSFRRLAGSNQEPVFKLVSKFIYNRQLRSSWYIFTGVIGSILSLVAMMREKEEGTLEHLLLTPASVWEIVAAKFLPIFALLMLDVLVGILLSALLFNLPLCGNLAVFFLGTSIYISICTGLGVLLATFCQSQRQAQLCSLFISIPIIQLSGSLLPFESMPPFLQALSLVDPLRYFTVLVRATLLKSAGLALVIHELLVLLVFAFLINILGLLRFRKQSV